MDAAPFAPRCAVVLRELAPEARRRYVTMLANRNVESRQDGDAWVANLRILAPGVDAPALAEKPAAKPKPPPPPPKPKPPPPPPRAPEPPSRPARVAHPYDAAEPWQLSAAEGDAVNILETHEDGWTDVVTSDGARGMLPVSYLAEE